MPGVRKQVHPVWSCGVSKVCMCLFGFFAFKPMFYTVLLLSSACVSNNIISIIKKYYIIIRIYKKKTLLGRKEGGKGRNGGTKEGRRHSQCSR